MRKHLRSPHFKSETLSGGSVHEYSNNLLAPIMAHAVWNISGAIVMGGVSLAEDYPHVFNMVSRGNLVLSGGSYLIEASVAVLILNIIFGIFFLLLARKRDK